MTKRHIKNIHFGHFGNGITVWYSGKSSFEKLAHINIYRQITYYVDLEKKCIQTIEDFSNNQNPTISETQDTYVFLNKI